MFHTPGNTAEYNHLPTRSRIWNALKQNTQGTVSSVVRATGAYKKGGHRKSQRSQRNQRSQSRRRR
jgi:hypothetical protein